MWHSRNCKRCMFSDIISVKNTLLCWFSSYFNISHFVFNNFLFCNDREDRVQDHRVIFILLFPSISSTSTFISRAHRRWVTDTIVSRSWEVNHKRKLRCFRSTPSHFSQTFMRHMLCLVARDLPVTDRLSQVWYTLRTKIHYSESEFLDDPNF